MRMKQDESAEFPGCSGASGVPLLVVRTTPISQWKGLNSSQVALGCVHDESRKSHSVPGRKVSLQMSADRFSSDGAENVGENRDADGAFAND